MMIIRRVIIKVKVINLNVNLSTYSTYINNKRYIAGKDCNSGVKSGTMLSSFLLKRNLATNDKKAGY